MQIKYTKLDVVPGGEPQRFSISQGDKQSRTLAFTLFAGDGALDLPQGATVTLEGKKPDGSSLIVGGSLAGIGARFLLPESAARVPGQIPCNVVIRSGTQRLYTETFFLVVDRKTKE